jgi:hypothetical protein
LCTAQALCREQAEDPRCVLDCVSRLGHGSGNEPGCTAADAALTACRADLPCDVLQDGDSYRACEADLRVMLTACGLCMFMLGWVDTETCFVDDLCPDGHHRIECDADTCICTHDGAFLKACPSIGCAPDGIPPDAYACCP